MASDPEAARRLSGYSSVQLAESGPAHGSWRIRILFQGAAHSRIRTLPLAEGVGRLAEIASGLREDACFGKDARLPGMDDCYGHCARTVAELRLDPIRSNLQRGEAQHRRSGDPLEKGGEPDRQVARIPQRHAARSAAGRAEPQAGRMLSWILLPDPAFGFPARTVPAMGSG